MSSLKLPEIPFGGPTPSAADRIDRAGDAFSKAAGAGAGFLADLDLAEIQTQAQEASLQTTKAAADTLHVAKSYPYMKPEQVRSLFPNKPPEGVSLTEMVTLPGGGQEEHERAVIPTHEFIPQLIEQQMGAAIENAASRIKGAGWQGAFRQAAAKDMERVRGEALDWQRAQRLADLEVQAGSQFNQLVAARLWDQAALVAERPGLSLKFRQTVLADLPRLRTKATVEDALRSRDPAVLDKVQSDIAGNNFEHAKLSPEEQLQFSTAAQHRKHEIQTEQEHAEKRAYEAKTEGLWKGIERATAEARRTGKPLSAFVSVNDLLDMKGHDFTTALAYLDAQSKPMERKTDNNAWAALDAEARSGRLVGMSISEVRSYTNRMSEPDERTWLDRWAKAKEGGGKATAVPDDVDKVINVVLKNKGYDPVKHEGEFNDRRAQSQKAYLLWREKNPEKLFTYADANAYLTHTVFNAKSDPWLGRGTERGWYRENLGNPEATVSALTVGLSNAFPGRPVSDTDVQEQVRLMKAEEPLVTAAWGSLNNNKETPLTEDIRALVRGTRMNPEDMKLVDAQLTKQGARLTEENRIIRIVANLQPRQNRAGAEEIAKELVQDKKKVESRKIVNDDVTARKAAEVQMTAAEKAAYDKLPGWEREATAAAKEEFTKNEDLLTEQIRRRAYIEAGVKYNYTYTPGQPITDPLRVATDKRVAAEVAEGREARRAEFESRQRLSRNAYRVYFEEQMVNADGSVKTFAPAGFLTFPQWSNAQWSGGTAVAGSRSGGQGGW